MHRMGARRQEQTETEESRFVQRDGSGEISQRGGRFELETHAMETSTHIARRRYFEIENCISRGRHVGMFSRANASRLGRSKHHVHRRRTSVLFKSREAKSLYV